MPWIVEALDIVEDIYPGIVSRAVDLACRALGVQGHEKKLSIAALSRTFPDRLIEQVMP